MTQGCPQLEPFLGLTADIQKSLLHLGFHWVILWRPSWVARRQDQYAHRSKQENPVILKNVKSHLRSSVRVVSN